MIKLSELKDTDRIINCQMEVHSVGEVKRNIEHYTRDTWYIAHEYTKGGFSLGDHVGIYK